jgi:mono/diheme cytochrome c family protein
MITRALRAFSGGIVLRGIAFAIALFALSFAAQAASSANGSTLFNSTANCLLCHGGPTDNPVFNAAGASSVISHAISNGMGACFLNTAGNLGSGCARSLSGPELDDIAAYINVAATPDVDVAQPTGVAVVFQTTKTGIALPNIAFNTTWGGGSIQAIAQVNPAPTKGTVSFPAGTTTANYTPFACQTGSDTVNFQGTGAGGPTNTRSFTVSIAGPTVGPTVTSGANASGQTGVFQANAYTTSYTPNCPSLTTFGASGLPPGLSISASGVVSGTPTTVGTYNATITATQNGHATNKGVQFDITLGPPVITSANTKSGAVGFALSYQITATNPPHTSYNATGLPAGLSVDTTTGLISGTPTVNGSFPVTVSATNSTNTGQLVVTFNIAVGVPVINSSPTASGQTGQPFNYQITATNGPTSYSATGLPAGLSINTGTGLISGTPTTIASTPVTLTATNGTGTSSNFTLTIDVTLGPPIINSPLTANGAAGAAFSYQITATQNPTSFNATGLPAGLAVDTTTGVISGTPTVGGSFPVTISATNATGTGSNTLTINVALFAPTINSSLTASGQTGIPFTYQITAANAPTSFNATGLPAGLSVDTNTGIISGMPSAVGTTNITISATNGAGTDSKTLVLTVTLGPPFITSGATVNGIQGTALSYQITATNSPASYGATGLPTGVTVNPANGLISGTPTVFGVFNVTVSATNATGTGTKPVSFNILIGPPVVTSANSAVGQTGTAFTYQIVATNSPTSYNATGLPAGLTVDTTTGRITGVPIPSGTFSATISATNGTGTGSQSLTVAVSQGAPGISSPTTAAATTGQPFTYQITAANSPTSFSATGLPPGLTLDTTTGFITGTPTAGGTYTVTLTASNSSSTTSQVLTITVAFIAPTAADLAVTTGFNTAIQINIPAIGAVTQITIVAQPAHGTLSAIPAGSTRVTYTPTAGFSGEDTFTYSATGPGGTSGTGTITVRVGTQAPIAAALAMTVQLNSALTVDLKPFITGSGVTGVAIVTAPAHGTASVNGTKVTYAPQRDFFGADSFTYRAFGNAGDSAPATVSVTVIGRSDPSKDATVIGVVDAQSTTTQRLARAQMGNIQQHLQSLHSRAGEPERTARREPERARPSGSRRTARRSARRRHPPSSSPPQAAAGSPARSRAARPTHFRTRSRTRS